MKEIGGYFELERLVNKPHYKDLIEFNSARNCLLYIVKKRKIKKIYLPYLLCDVITDICLKNNVEVEFYEIDDDFLPIINSGKIDNYNYLYVINYYGLFNNDVLIKLKEKYKYLIVDNTHSFFQEPIKSIDTIYNCRKYFGVPDGAYLSTNLAKDKYIEVGKSSFRIKHLIGRFEGKASDYYNDFKVADESFDNEEILYMSNFTKNILGAIDYDFVLKRRKNNFKLLHDKLKKYNKLKIINENCNYMYPLFMEDAEELRKYLISKKIYIPTLWPNVLNDCSNNMFEYKIAKNILPIPIDQRYNNSDMEYIVKLIVDFMEGSKNNEL